MRSRVSVRLSGRLSHHLCVVLCAEPGRPYDLCFLLSAANVATSGSVTDSPVQSATVLLITRPPHAAAAGLLLSARRAGDIHHLLPGLSSIGAASRRSAANAGSVMLTADVGS